MTTLAAQKPSLEMKIDLNVIDHLGLKMYTSLPAVIAEYVANSWDAGARKVEIHVPQGSPTDLYQITIADDGFGMTVSEVNDKFLVVGRNRRDEETETIKLPDGTERKVMGRKGLGKLAGFGIADQVYVRTCRDGNFIEFVMDYAKMLERVKAGGLNVKTSYSPNVLEWGKTEETNGTLVQLRNLKRKRPVDLDDVRGNLARNFSIIDTEFEVAVNGESIIPAHMRLREQCKKVWEISETIEGRNALSLEGWIGISSEPLPKDITGVVVMTRGRLVQTPTTFDAGGIGTRGVVYLPSLVGELHAEFLDDKEDMIGTGRRSIIRETEEGQLLWTWGTTKVKSLLSEWVDTRAKEKLDEVRKLPVYEQRIAKLPNIERKAVENFLSKIAEKEEVETATVERVADFLASGAEYESFLTLVDAIERADATSPEILVDLFRDWEILDAIEMARIVEGRLDVLNKFQQYVEGGAREVPELHNFLVDNPWLLDPTWDYLQDEVQVSKLLGKKFPDSDGGRIDFLCLGHGNTLNVIELKRPSVAIGRKELEQLESYVDQAAASQGNDPRVSYANFVGYVVGGRISGTPGVSRKAQRLAGASMYIRTYSDLRRTAYNSHVRFVDVLKRKALRIKDVRLQESIERLEQGARATEARMQ
jgi:hypothetical protein